MGKLSSATMLIEYGGDVNGETPHRETPFLLACREGHVDIMQHLFLVRVGNKAVDLRAVEWQEKNGIHLAAEQGHLRAVQFLLKHCPDLLNHQDEYQETPCHYACENGHIAAAKELIRAGADLSRIDKHGRSVLDCMENAEARRELEEWARTNRSVGDEDSNLTDLEKEPSGEILNNIREVQMQRFTGKANLKFQIMSRPPW
jgi:ankyrin repeat protein